MAEVSGGVAGSGSQDKPLISVVIPVYNVENYLDWCLDSLLDQSMENFEIVCVNDESTDDSLAVLERRQKLDSRIRIVNRENGGPSAARNTGIRAARADIVSFLDADDRFKPHALGIIYDTFEKTGADIVTYGAECFPEDEGDEWIKEHLSPRDAVFDEFDPKLVFSENATPYPRTSCRRDFLLDNDVMYEEDMRLGEDQLFYMLAYPKSSKTVLLSNKLYIYNVGRRDSITNHVDFSSAFALRRHLVVMDRAFLNWKKQFPNNEYASDIIAWSVDYALHGIMCLGAGERSELSKEYCRILLTYWDEGFVRSLELGGSKKAFLDMALGDKPVSDLQVTVQRWNASVEENGFAGTLAKAARKIVKH